MKWKMNQGAFPISILRGHNSIAFHLRPFAIVVGCIRKAFASLQSDLLGVVYAHNTIIFTYFDILCCVGCFFSRSKFRFFSDCSHLHARLLA